MKIISRLSCISLILLSLALLGACAKEQVTPYTPSDAAGAPEGRDIEYASPEYGQEMGPSEESLDSTGYNEQQGAEAYGAGVDPESEEYKKMYGRSTPQFLPIYFDFDQASIRSDQFPRLDQNADYLRDTPGARVVIEGNCDDRGTNEYNLALGERRALNAKTYLVEIGIDEDRIRTVSYGEERPLFEGQDEYSWSQNRRDDFVLE